MSRFELGIQSKSRYTCTASKEVGFDSPLNRAVQAATPVTGTRLLPLWPRFMAAQAGGSDTCRFARAVPGLSTRLGCRPCLTACVAVDTTEPYARAIMAETLPLGASARILTHARFDRAPVVQTRTRGGRLPKTVASLRQYLNAKSYAAWQAKEKLKEVNELRKAIAQAEAIGHTLRYDLAAVCTRQSTFKGALYV
jgi:hypothetical protein